MYDRILLPTDGSTGTAHVALQAIDLANQYGATIHALHVIDTDMRSVLTEVGSGFDTLEQRGENAVGTVERLGQSHGIEVETEIRNGDPAETILAVADELDADLIVCGTHGRSGVRRQLLGSVAERVVRHASQPVLTVQLPETDVTVETEQQARELASEALEEDGYDAEVTNAERQLNVWVVDAETDDRTLLVYLDPQTRRTSIIER
ncbi:MAG: universal stress protein [Halovenus sp.]|uniref:universal stress protein n=1 Tax=Halovenus amylolytica TaxID=2500550 RepID=UPI000FE38CA7